MKNITIVITKPLQLINILNVLEQKGVDYNFVNLIIIDHFNGSELLYEKIKNSYIKFKTILFVKTIFHIFKSTTLRDRKGIDILYTNSDISKDGFIYNILYPNASLSIYEEGWGTYINNVLFDQSLKKQMVYAFLNLPKKYGSSKSTKKIYCYKPELINKSLQHKTIKIVNRLPDFVNDKMKYLSSIFNVPYIGKKNILILLSSKEFDNNILTYMSDDYDDIFIKPHPHTSYMPSTVFDNVKILDNSVFPELMIIQGINDGATITVIHDGSSIEYNMDSYSSDKLKFINIGKGKHNELDKLLNSLVGISDT